MTDSLGAGGFGRFFEQLRGREPFPWQAELAELLVQGDVPDVIDVPTGLGKTSVIDVWAYALAAAAPGGARVPRRLCFVVDRRLVVDGAHQSAEQLRERLLDGTGPVGEVAERLRALTGGEADPLAVVRMRGGVTWESRWLARPDQAALVVGTVDQFGSRLLFRGFGASPRMRPVDAALVGTDAWLVLDEAHIARPLAASVRSVERLQQQEQGPARPLRATLMTATVADSGTAVFGADPDAQMDSARFPAAAQAAAARLRAEKPACPVRLGWLDGPAGKRWREKSVQLGTALAGIAAAAEPEARVLGVVANTIGTARAAHRRLVELGETAVLLTGRCRAFEREQLLADWLPHVEVGSSRSFDGRMFVVATQTVEVGANLDFDALVTECAPLSSLIQRFGRVNRVGARQAGRSAVVYAGFAHAEDPVYGGSTSATWEYLSGQGVVVEAATARRLPRLGDAEAAALDFGPLPARRLADAAPPGTAPEAPFTPTLTGAHAERWACTNPAPMPDQPVDAFLHGLGHDVPEVGVAWRAAPPAAGAAPTAEDWQRWVELAPPTEWEFVQVPLWDARALVAGTPVGVPTTDLEGVLGRVVDEPTAQGDEVVGIVHRGRGTLPTLVRPSSSLAAGDRLVLRSDLGGHDRYGWTGPVEGQGPVPDVADLTPSRRQAVRRLTRSVLETWSPDLDGDVRAALQVDQTTGEIDAEAALSAIEASSALPAAVRAAFRQASSWRVTPTQDPSVVLLTAPTARWGLDAVSDDDEASTSQAGVAATLGGHGEEVGVLAGRFAEHLELDRPLVEAVSLAGRLHDLGKADRRFQLMLHDGDQIAAAAAPALLAKSGRDPRDPVARRAALLARVPTGFRHEAVSARLAQEYLARVPDLGDSVDPELVVHLVAAHHGWGRPLMRPLLDPDAPEVSVDVDGQSLRVEAVPAQVDWSQPGRFERLGGRYGWWGLALLESLVRLADMLASERASKTGARS